MAILLKGDIYIKNMLYWQKYIDSKTKEITLRWALDKQELEKFNKQFKKLDSS